MREENVDDVSMRCFFSLRLFKWKTRLFIATIVQRTRTLRGSRVTTKSDDDDDNYIDYDIITPGFEEIETEDDWR